MAIEKDQRKKVISAGGIIFWKNGSKIFVCLVKRNRKDVWIFPRGRLEVNENMENAVIREVKEETGIIARVIRKIGVIKYSFYSSSDKKYYDKEVHFYLLKMSKQERFIPNEEIQEMRWMEIEEAIKLLSYEQEREILLKSLKFIT